MGIYKFRVCSKKDLPLLLDFIDKYWRKNHILVRSKDILDFQYYNKEEDNYSFLLAENQETGEIDGIRGWIRVAQYDPALAENDDVWSAVWKVRTDVTNEEIKLLGSFLGRYLNRHKGFGTVGISKFSYAMHTALRHTMCTLSQYFILNPDITDFKIAKIPVCHKINYCKKSEWHIKEIDNIMSISDAEVKAVYKPQKSITYLFNRFQNHPIYQYHFYGIYHGEKIESVLVGRFVDINNSRILHIVDVLGALEPCGSLYWDLVEILRRTSSEYVDMLCYGVDESVFIKIGFEKLNPDSDKLIIPNYFEPFIQQNIIINGAFKPVNGYTMFKADADQDRPS